LIAVKLSIQTSAFKIFKEKMLVDLGRFLKQKVQESGLRKILNLLPIGIL